MESEFRIITFPTAKVSKEKLKEIAAKNDSTLHFIIVDGRLYAAFKGKIYAVQLKEVKG